MRVAILAWGTRGDVQPMLAIGEDLTRRGHSVVLTVNPNLTSWARKSGLDVVEIQPDLDCWFRSPEGVRVLASGDFRALAKEIGALQRRASTHVTRACVAACEGADVVASTVMTAFRGECMAARHGIPHGVLMTFPVHPTARFSHPLMPFRDAGFGALNRATFALAYRIWWRSAQENVNGMARDLGVPPFVERPRIEALPAAVLCSPALLERPADWGANITVTGAPRLSETLRARLGECEAPEGLDAWLDAGDPPVYFGFGSMPVQDPATTLRHIEEATARRGLRALVGAGWTDYGGRALPAHVFMASMLDHEAVLPRCRAAVHHGGAGTVSAVARAGLPALVASVWADQPFWGWRTERLGLGAHVPFRHLTPARLDRALDTVLTPATSRRARDIAPALLAETGAARAADAILSWGRAPSAA